MLFCILSDTHGCYPNMESLIAGLDQEIRLVLHLGDDSGEAEIFKKHGYAVTAVPGVFEDHYQYRDTKRRLVREISGIKFLLTHTPEKHSMDLAAEKGPAELSREADIVLYGHTHIPAVDKREGIYWVNPGHLKTGDKRGFPPTYAIIGITEQGGLHKVKITIRELHTGKIHKETEIKI